jgi:glycine/D-amino acid oxidase-like deaminating enzyme
MDIRTENPFWLMNSGILEVYSCLKEELSTEYVIIGGGISGALATWHLAKAGVPTVTLERRHIGFGSTAASTALLQYDIDHFLFELCEMYGEDFAVRAYEKSADALKQIGEIVAQLYDDCGFANRSSVYYAAHDAHAADLEKEYKIRQKHGFDIEIWDEQRIADAFPFRSVCALYTKQAAIVDPYKFTHALLQDAQKRGAKIFDKTEVLTIEQTNNGVTLHTSQGYRVKAKKVVMAGGYEALHFLPRKVTRLDSTYAIISEPQPTPHIWFENCVLWDTGTPYLYARTTTDNRIIFGGGDESFYSPERRNELLPRKTAELVATFERQFPDIKMNADFSWAGTFAVTDDSLPFIGEVEKLPNVIFALGYGGNGITFSQIAAEIICDTAQGKNNPYADVFSFDRQPTVDKPRPFA